MPEMGEIETVIRPPSRRKRVKLGKDERSLLPLSSISRHCFVGSVTIQPRLEALQTARQFDLADPPNQLVLWVDGSTSAITRNCKVSSVAVVRRGLRFESGWVFQSRNIRNLGSSSRAEFIAISQGLEVAVDCLTNLTDGSSLNNDPMKVKVFQIVRNRCAESAIS